jgi:hypothetical protein
MGMYNNNMAGMCSLAWHEACVCMACQHVMAWRQRSLARIAWLADGTACITWL